MAVQGLGCVLPGCLGSASPHGPQGLEGTRTGGRARAVPATRNAIQSQVGRQRTHLSHEAPPVQI